MGNIYTHPIPCPQAILDESNNGSIWRFNAKGLKPPVPKPKNNDFMDSMAFSEVFYFFEPFIFNKDVVLFIDLVAIIMMVVILGLNRKKWIKSHCLYLFTNYFVGFLLFRTTSRFAHNLYYGLWNILKHHFAWCLEEAYMNDTSIRIWFAEDPNFDTTSPIRIKIFGVSIFSLIYTNNDAIKLAHNHISAAFLIVHRLSIYFACAHPIIFKRYFTAKNLHFYYLIVGFAFMIYVYAYYFQPDGYEMHLAYFLPVIKWTSVAFLGIHSVITVLSVRVVWKFSQTSKAEVQEIRSFIAFSIYPVAFSVFDIIFGVSTSGALISIGDLFFIHLVVYSLLDMFYSLSSCIAIILFIPNYRKIILKLYRRRTSVSKPSLFG